MCSRDGEVDASFLRSDRFQKLDGHWRVRTREGEWLGPFMRREQAVAALDSYITGVVELNERELLRRLDYILDCNGSGTSMTVDAIYDLLDRYGQGRTHCNRTQQLRLQGLRAALSRRHPQQRVRVVLRGS